MILFAIALAVLAIIFVLKGFYIVKYSKLIVIYEEKICLLLKKN